LISNEPEKYLSAFNVLIYLTGESLKPAATRTNPHQPAPTRTNPHQLAPVSQGLARTRTGFAPVSYRSRTGFARTRKDSHRFRTGNKRLKVDDANRHEKLLFIVEGIAKSLC
jgi:hypothetical protein